VYFKACYLRCGTYPAIKNIAGKYLILLKARSTGIKRVHLMRCFKLENIFIKTKRLGHETRVFLFSLSFPLKYIAAMQEETEITSYLTRALGLACWSTFQNSNRVREFCDNSLFPSLVYAGGTYKEDFLAEI